MVCTTNSIWGMCLEDIYKTWINSPFHTVTVTHVVLCETQPGVVAILAGYLWVVGSQGLLFVL